MVGISNNKIARSLCRDLVDEVYDLNGSTMIATQLRFRGGDMLPIFLQDSQSDLYYTDDGFCMRWLATEGHDVSDRKMRSIDIWANEAGAIFTSGRLYVDCDPRNPEKGFVALCGLAMKISALLPNTEYEDLGVLGRDIEKVVTHVASQTGAKIMRRWTSPQFDEDKLYPVDWCMQRKNEAKHIFAIRNVQRINGISNTVRFLREKGVKPPTIAILDHDLRIGRKPYQRLAQVSDEIVFNGVEENREKVISWLSD